MLCIIAFSIERKPISPHNVSLVVLGTFMLWLGWIGFNAGSAFGANLRAVYAAWNSNICAAMAGITWCLLDFRLERKVSFSHFPKSLPIFMLN